MTIQPNNQSTNQPTNQPLCLQNIVLHTIWNRGPQERSSRFYFSNSEYRLRKSVSISVEQWMPRCEEGAKATAQRCPVDWSRHYAPRPSHPVAEGRERGEKLQFWWQRVDCALVNTLSPVTNEWHNGGTLLQQHTIGVTWHYYYSTVRI